MLNLRHTLVFITESNIIYNAAASNTITVTHQPPSNGAYLKVGVSGGTSNTGTITITGTLDNAAKSNTITFTGNRWYITTNQFDNILAVTSSGLEDEVIPPTVKIESVDMGSNPVNWSALSTHYGLFQQINSKSYSGLAQMIGAGNKAFGLYRCVLDGDHAIGSNDKFCVTKQTGTYQVQSEPEKHFQLGTDLIDYTHFLATKISSETQVEEISEVTPNLNMYDLDSDGVIDMSEKTYGVRKVTEFPLDAVEGDIVLIDGKLYIYKSS